jgi:hypothetical protein
MFLFKAIHRGAAHKAIEAKVIEWSDTPTEATANANGGSHRNQSYTCAKVELEG